MNKPHKWAKEIHAWADGAEIEFKFLDSGSWKNVQSPLWNNEGFYFRIKPQPKEPQYLYVYRRYGEHFLFETAEERGMILVGKIKLEQDE
jgi:hypothetical protein